MTSINHTLTLYMLLSYVVCLLTSDTSLVEANWHLVITRCILSHHIEGNSTQVKWCSNTTHNPWLQGKTQIPCITTHSITNKWASNYRWLFATEVIIDLCSYTQLYKIISNYSQTYCTSLSLSLSLSLSSGAVIIRGRSTITKEVRLNQSSPSEESYSFEAVKEAERETSRAKNNAIPHHALGKQR